MVRQGLDVLALARLTRVAVAGVALSAALVPVAWGQNLTAGKTPAQLYAQTCVACHGKPQTLAGAAATNRSLDGFLRQHYTSSREEAALMAAYVRDLGGGPALAGPGRAATSRTGIPAAEPKAARPARGTEHVRVPDERAPTSRSRRQPAPKPDESRPAFDNSPVPATIPALPEAASPPAPVEQPMAPSAQAPVRVEEPSEPKAAPAAEPASEPAKDQSKPASDTAATPHSDTAPAAPASSGAGAVEAQ